MTNPAVHVADDPDTVAAQAASRVMVLLHEAQAARGDASVVLTGGSVARTVHALLATEAASAGVDWSQVTFWWGDDRYVPSDDEDRNAGQAWEDLLQHLPLDPARVHAMPAEDDEYLDADAAAWAYAEQLRDTVPDEEAWFDVLMLGIGPDGHCASLFPGHPEVRSEADVLAVHDAPKPPPTRISLGMRTLGRARNVLFVATGEEKAEAVARSVSGEDCGSTPAAGPRGLAGTEWYVDAAAAASLP